MDFNFSITEIMLAICVGFFIFYLVTAYRFVPRPWVYVVEINLPWKPTKVIIWNPGIHFLLIPIYPIMRIANKLKITDIPTKITIGKEDNEPGDPSLVDFINTSAAVTVQLVTRVDDPIKATYEVDGYLETATNLIEAKLRQVFASMSLDEAMQGENRDEVTQDLLLHLYDSLSGWGVKIISLALVDFDLPENVLAQRNKKVEAEKDKEVKIILAEGEARAKIIQAKSEGQAEWNKIQTIAQKLELKPMQVIAYLLSQEMMNAMDASTLVLSTSKEGNLNLPHINMATSMAAIQNALANKPKE